MMKFLTPVSSLKYNTTYDKLMRYFDDVKEEISHFIYVRKILKYLPKKIFYIIYNKRLPTPNSIEKESMEKFKKQMESLVNSLEDLESVPEWKKTCERILDLTLKDDVRRFLRWVPIQEKMNISFAFYLRKELEFLKKSDNWDSRWKNAIREVSFGSPIPFFFYRKSSGNLIHHAYHLARFETNLDIRINDLDYVFEFGGGYGSMCRLFYNLGFKGKYIIFDLPHFSLLQTFYLKGIGLKVENKNIKKWSQILCISNLEKLKEVINHNLNFNSIFLSTWAFSEVPIKLREEFNELYQNFSYFLIAYQHKVFGIDNEKYFRELRPLIETINSKNKRIVKWNNFTIQHLYDNSYLFGKVLN